MGRLRQRYYFLLLQPNYLGGDIDCVVAVQIFSKMLRTKMWGGRGSLEWSLLNSGLTWE